MTKDYFVVQYHDLEDLDTSVKSLARAIGNFHGYLRYKQQPAGKSAYANVTSEPLIIKAMEKI